MSALGDGLKQPRDDLTVTVLGCSRQEHNVLRKASPLAVQLDQTEHSEHRDFGVVEVVDLLVGDLVVVVVCFVVVVLVFVCAPPRLAFAAPTVRVTVI